MPMKSSPQSQNMFMWNINRQRLQGRPIDLLFVLMVKKKKKNFEGFPRNVRASPDLIDVLLSGESQDDQLFLSEDLQK